MNICFIINPWESLDPEDDSTLRLIHESVVRGHNVGVLYPHNLTIRESQTMGFVRKIKKQDKYSSSFPVFHKKVEFKEQLLPLEGFDVIFARSNPPIDPVMLNFLDSVKDDTFIKVAGKYAEGVYATGPMDTSKNPMTIAATKEHQDAYGSDPGAFS